MRNTEMQQTKKFCIIIVYFFVIELFFYISVIPDKTSRQILMEHTDLLEYPCCLSEFTKEMQYNVFFLRTNQDGSSIVFNILARLGINYGLSFMLPDNPSDTSLQPAHNTETLDNKYNVIVHYSKFTPELTKFAYLSAVRITILQDPIPLFQTYYDKYKSRNPKSKFADFLNAYHNHSEGIFNPMSRQLGLSEEITTNDTLISDFIAQIENQFDFVLIYEHLDISLVLLANLMGWPLSSVTNIIPPRRSIYTFNEVNKIKISELNYADTILYHHFLTKLENCAIQYGVNKLLEEMKTLLEINEIIVRYCTKDFIQNEDILDDYSWECEMIFRSEEDFIKLIKTNQIQRIAKEKEMTDSVLIT